MGVFAPTHWIHSEDLSGNYGGLTAGVAIDVGGNANALVGGSNKSLKRPFRMRNALCCSAGLRVPRRRSPMRRSKRSKASTIRAPPPLQLPRALIARKKMRHEPMRRLPRR